MLPHDIPNRFVPKNVGTHRSKQGQRLEERRVRVTAKQKSLQGTNQHRLQVQSTHKQTYLVPNTSAKTGLKVSVHR